MKTHFGPDGIVLVSCPGCGEWIEADAEWCANCDWPYDDYDVQDVEEVPHDV